MQRKIEQSGFGGEPQFLNFDQEEKASVESEQSETSKEVLHEPITRENLIAAILRTRGHHPYKDQLPSTQLVAKKTVSGPKYVFSYNHGNGHLSYDELIQCNEILKSIDVEAQFEAAQNLPKKTLPVQQLRNVDVPDEGDSEDRGYERDRWGGINYK